MNKLTCVLPLLLFLNLTSVTGQGRLLLEHKKKTGKKKNIASDRHYYITTTDTTYYSEIIAFSDTSLSITAWVKTGRDTSYTYTSRISNTKETTLTVARPLYQHDTTVIAFSQIQTIKKNWFANRRWLEPFGWIAIGAALGVVLLPVAAIDDGYEGVKDWAVFEGTLLAIVAPPIIIGTRKTKYNLQTKWNSRTEK